MQEKHLDDRQRKQKGKVQLGKFRRIITMSKKLVKIFGLLLMVGLLFAALPQGQVEAATPVYVDDDFTTSTPGWGTTHFASIEA